MKMEDIFYWIEKYRSQVKLFLVPTIMLMIVGVYGFVHVTGGIKYVFSHSMYLPIAVAAITFGAKGGVLAALVGGLLLGPLMPIDTLTGEPQDTINWLYRIGFFTLIGFLVGITSDLMFSYLNRIKWNANHDSMTGLPNIFALATRVKNLSRSGTYNDQPRFLLVALLDNQTEIETSFGAHYVNGVISQLADTIRNEFQNLSPVYRIGAERLGFVQHAEHDHSIRQQANKLGDIFTLPLKFGDIRLHADIYLGIVALDGVGAVSAPELYIQRASHAATQASKVRARDAVMSNIDDDARITENLELLGEVAHALTNDQIFMHYQPKVVAATGIIHGVEALMRWQHPARGNIPPSKFIPYAENSTLIDQITYFAIDQSLAQLVAWEKNGLENIHMAVNISTRNLSNPEFTSSVIELLELHGVKGEKLELEITESSFMDDMDSSIIELTKLAGAGIILSIDDFGTGYSSLQYMEKMPVSIIKIDQGFVRTLPAESGSRQIVEAAIGLAHNLGMKVIAEGVENREAYDFLLSAGCDLIQGYFVSHPVSGIELEKTCMASKGRLVNV